MGGIVRIVPNIPQTLDIAAVAAVIGIVLGFLLALFRIKKFPVLSQFATLYISFMRGTPLLVQLFLSYYGIPVMLNILNYKFGWEFSVNDIPSMLFVFVAFSLNEAAYMAESIRAAILSVDRKDIKARAGCYPFDCGSGLTMIIVTHEMSFARDVSDRVAYFAEGNILEQGTPEEVFEHTREEGTKQFLTHMSAR